jgi:hypothetical protein
MLLLGPALAASCDRSPAGPPATAAGPALKAADGSCRLPLDHFASSLYLLVGSRLGVPSDRVWIDREGRTRWNGEPVGSRRLGDYVAAQATAEAPVFLSVRADPDAPCAVVQATLAIALRAGRCTPRRCAFEWEPGFPPPPPNSLPPGPEGR